MDLEVGGAETLFIISVGYDCGPPKMQDIIVDISLDNALANALTVVKQVENSFVSKIVETYDVAEIKKRLLDTGVYDHDDCDGMFLMLKCVNTKMKSVVRFETVSAKKRKMLG
jgi:hypothetical protein